MYYMIGGDEKEYGPISAEQLREYIAAGRADASIRVKKEGDPVFKTLAEFPEFADALAARPAPAPPAPAAASQPAPHVTAAAPLPGPLAAPPFPPPSTGTLDPDALAADALARNCEINIGLSLGRAWDLMKNDFWPIVGVSAIVLLLIAVASKFLVGIVVNGPLLGGLYCYYLKRIRGQSAELNDAFSGFSSPNFLQLFLGALVSSILVAIGLSLCIVPGIYLAVAWQLAMPIIQDKRIGFWEAMEVSRKVLTRHWWVMLGLVLVIGLINIAGAILCGVGLFVSAPLSFIALAYVYEDLFGAPRALPELTAGTPPWPPPAAMPPSPS